MDAQTFNNLAELANREFLFSLFGIPVNTTNEGIDHIDHNRKIALELKGAHTNRENTHYKVGVHQIYDYPKRFPGYSLYWAFMRYATHSAIVDISPEAVPHEIKERQIWLFDWKYIHTFTAFDESIHEAYGSDGMETLRNILTPGELDILDSATLKTHMHIPHREIYIRSNRKATLLLGDTEIILDTRTCGQLLEAHRQGPYKERKQEQLGLFDHLL